MPHSRAKNAPRGVCFVCGAVTEEHWHKECKVHRKGRLDRQAAHKGRRLKMFAEAFPEANRRRSETNRRLADEKAAEQAAE